MIVNDIVTILNEYPEDIEVKMADGSPIVSIKLVNGVLYVSDELDLDLDELVGKNGREEDPVLEMSIADLFLFYRFCHNRVDFDMFRKLFDKNGHHMESYTMGKYKDFKGDYVGFIVTGGEVELAEGIKQAILDSKYKG
jgi:hypothetical protein